MAMAARAGHSIFRKAIQGEIGASLLVITNDDDTYLGATMNAWLYLTDVRLQPRPNPGAIADASRPGRGKG